MKQAILLSFKIFILSLICSKAMAQAPQSIAWQAVVRDTSGNVVANQNISLRFKIHTITPAGTIVYSESHSVTTSTIGLANVNVGTGTVLSGSFSSISWGADNKYLQVELDAAGGTNYTDMGTTQMLSVPYALYSASSGGNASGDLSGSYPNPTVSKINGSPLGTTTGASNGQVLKFNGTTWSTGTDNNSGGTVSSVGLTMPSGFSVTGSPVTSSGTLAVGTTLNGPLRGNGSGITTGNLNLQTEVTSTLRIANGGTNSSTALTGSSIMISNGTSIIQGSAGTSNTVLHGNISGAPTFGSVSLTTDVTGVLPAANLPSLSGDVTGAVNSNSVTKIRGVNVSSTPPTNTQVLRYNSGTSQWEPQTISSASGWSLTGNSNTVDTTNFIGTTDNHALSFRVLNQKAGKIDADYPSNTFFGFHAGNVNAATENVAVGHYALSSETNGSRNVAVGQGTLLSSVSGYGNVAIGFQAQTNADDGNAIPAQMNTSVGYQALAGSVTPSNNTGINNTSVGGLSMFSNTSGSKNSVNGFSAMYSNTTGSENTASGFNSLVLNTTGNRNNAAGLNSMRANISGSDNTACGWYTLGFTTASNGNTALGSNAGAAGNNGDNNTFIGFSVNSTSPGFTNSTGLGAGVSITASNQVRVGDGVTSIGGPVGWSTISDARFKNNIVENIHGLDFIMKLKPVSYHLDLSSVKKQNEYQNSNDALNKIIFSGFVAQDVEKAALSVGYSFSGIDAPKNENDYYGLRYGDFVVPIVKAVQEQQAMISGLEKKIEQLMLQNEMLRANINDIKTQLKSE